MTPRDKNILEQCIINKTIIPLFIRKQIYLYVFQNIRYKNLSIYELARQYINRNISKELLNHNVYFIHDLFPSLEFSYDRYCAFHEIKENIYNKSIYDISWDTMDRQGIKRQMEYLAHLINL